MEGIHILLLYYVELQETKEEKKLGKDRVNFRRKEDFSENDWKSSEQQKE